MLEKIIFNNIVYQVKKLLGKGKGGYSYLVTKDEKEYVIKKIHHEPCSYYQFGNKLESEINDYNRLCQLDILLPKLIAIDYENELILKEYIDGPTIYEMVKNDLMKKIYYDQIKLIASSCIKHNLNIDYYPTNFIVNNNQLFYVDYECNVYDEKWNYENWGSKFWSKTEDFLRTIK